MSAVDALDMHRQSFEEYRRARNSKPSRHPKPFIGAKVRQMLIEGRGPASVQRLTGCSPTTIRRVAAMLREEGYDIKVSISDPGQRAAPAKLVIQHEFPSLPVDVGAKLRKAAEARGTDSNGLAAAILTTVVRDGLIDAVLEK